MMRCNAFQNPLERADFDRVMIRNDFVVFALLLCRNANVRALLTRIAVTKLAESFDQV